MQIREAMSTEVLSVGPAHSLRQAATLMSERKVGAAVVVDPDGNGPGILTERDIMQCVGVGGDVDNELVSAHLTKDLVFAAPTWTMAEAANAMVRGGFRHLIVMDDHEVAGVLSVRDIVRVWSDVSIELSSNPT